MIYRLLFVLAPLAVADIAAAKPNDFYMVRRPIRSSTGAMQ